MRLLTKASKLFTKEEPEEVKNGILTVAHQNLTSVPAQLSLPTKEQCSNITSLDLSFNCIADIRPVVCLPNLKTLVVDHNALRSSCTMALMPKLKLLSVNYNRISNLSVFVTTLKRHCPSLCALSMLKNVACPNYFNGGTPQDYLTYRAFLLHHIPTLQVIDSQQITREDTDACQKLRKTDGRHTIQPPSTPTSTSSCSGEADGSTPHSGWILNLGSASYSESGSALSVPPSHSHRPKTNPPSQRRRGYSFVREYEQEDQSSFRASMVKTRDTAVVLPHQLDSFKGKYTVVLDLDETLVYAREGPLFCRPYLEELLDFLGCNCETIVWSAASRAYAQAIIRTIDLDNVIQSCVYRHDKWFVNEAGYKKDLRYLGRDLDRTIIVENTPDCVRGHETFAVLVDDYDGQSPDDMTLPMLQELLSALVDSGKTVPQFLAASDLVTQQYVPTDLGDEILVYCVSANKADETRCNMDLSPSQRKRARRGRKQKQVAAQKKALLAQACSAVGGHADENTFYMSADGVASWGAMNNQHQSGTTP